jgi:hypothetical protein
VPVLQRGQVIDDLDAIFLQVVHRGKAVEGVERGSGSSSGSAHLEQSGLIHYEERVDRLEMRLVDLPGKLASSFAWMSAAVRLKPTPLSAGRESRRGGSAAFRGSSRSDRSRITSWSAMMPYRALSGRGGSRT